MSGSSPRHLRAFLAEAAADVPDRPLLIFEDEPVTYAQMEARSNQASRLWLDLGISAGDRVAIAAENRPEYLVAWFGLAKIGAVLVGINPRFQADEMAFIIENAGVRVAIVDGDRHATIATVAERLPLEVWSIDAVGDAPTFGQRIAEYDDAPIDVPLDPGDVISLIYTSGSTGTPKGVMLTHESFVLTGEAYVDWIRMTADDRPYVCLPLFHINAQSYSTMGTIAARATVVLARRFSASRFWPDVRTHGVTLFNVIGAMLVIITQGEPSPADRDHKVRLLYSSAISAMSMEQRNAIEERFGFRLMTGFGMSESTFGFIEPFDEAPRERSIGKPRQHPDPDVPPTEVRVVRDDGTDVEVGEPGELLLRSATMMVGYHNDPERTAEAMEDGWLHTGDLVKYDTDGYYAFVDRKKNVIRRRGENISSLEIERTLHEHPQVEMSAVIGVPSEYTEEDVLAFVVPVEGAEIDPQALWSWLDERLADYKVPRFLEFIDSLPTTATQKVSKPDLRELAAQGGRERHDREAARGRA